MVQFGVELGIRAKKNAIKKASLIADENTLDYFFVPETHPKFVGVDAFETLSEIADKTRNITLATGIVNVYSRNKQTMLRKADEIYRKAKGRFVLGIGTSTPVIIEKLYKMRFEKSLFRMRDYTAYIKNNHDVSVYWAVVGDKITQQAAESSDGVIFFLRPESEIKRSIKIIKNQLNFVGKSFDEFNIISIRPTYIEDSKHARNVARMTIANYVGANEFYSKPLEKAGYKKQVLAIRKNFAKHGLVEAAKHVSQKMVKELTTFGNPKECADGLAQHAKRTGIKTIVAGFDLPKDGYNADFFENLKSLVRRL
jgi:alkanesulfonate monooxygenase SsuD/methylene tetrahydromethanopterin reductase-like flavin-dependent oxidoreductase (luciferase family)